MKNLIDCFNFVSKRETISQNYSKSSFNRSGDDLTELVLSYLPFRDRISLECVSYQFTQLVYSNQKELTLNKQTFKNLMKDNFWGPPSIDTKLYGKFVRKLTQLKTLNIVYLR